VHPVATARGSASSAFTSKSNGECPDRHSAEKFLLSSMLPNANAAVDAVYHSDWGRIVATLIGHFGDFEVAEEAAQEAFTVAVDKWRTEGVPEFPRAWIVQTAKHKAIDRLRRRTRFQEKLESYAESGLIPTVTEPNYDAGYDTGEIPDDRLRLIFTCCHPALAPEAQKL
jgi:RNA polymerase sigma-70 factor (ECF subfamily)